MKNKEFKNKEFRQIIRHKRLLVDEESMEVCCQKIGISKTTLSRVESGKEFDLLTFVKILNWLEHEANHFIKE